MIGYEPLDDALLPLSIEKWWQLAVINALWWKNLKNCIRALLLVESWAEDSLLGELPHYLDDPEHPPSVQLAMDIVPEASLPGHPSDGLVPMNGKHERLDGKDHRSV